MTFKSLEQLQYWQGQALRSRDLNDQVGSAEQLRWWHNRASHGTFGVAFGLTRTPDGKTVGCGLAYDCFGRELVVSGDVRMPAVAAGEAHYLALAWRASGPQPEWITEDQARATAGILLARADASGVVDPAFRPVQSRALRRPRMASGATPPGNTPWEKIRSLNGVAIGLKVRIDTTAGGFSRKPLYVASLVWTAGENRRFTPPYVTIADAAADGFTVRLLLQGIGQEAIEVASEIKTLLPGEWSSHVVKSLLADDVVARVLPRIAKALRIDETSPAGRVLTLAGAPATLGLEESDAVVLAHLPRAPAVQRSTIAVEVGNVAGLSPKAVVFAGGSTVVVDQVLAPERLLLLEATVPGLQSGDAISGVAEVGTVAEVDPDGVTVTFQSPATLATTDRLVRQPDAIETVAPVGIASLTSPKVVVLGAPIPGLKKGDVLGKVGKAVTTVTAVTHVLIAVNLTQFAPGDVLRAADGARAIVSGIEDDLVKLAAPLTVASGGTVSVGEYGVRSTVAETPADAKLVRPRDPSLFAGGDIIALLDGTGNGALAISNVLAVTAGKLVLGTPLTGAKADDVVAVLRFSASAAITALSPLTVADATLFHPGDLVALTGAAAIDCWKVAGIAAGNVLVLESGGPTTMGTLAVVFPATVAIVKGVGDASITIDVSHAAQVGWFVASVERWIDVTPPVEMGSMLPDGILPGDSIGLAALTPSQPRIRFGRNTNVSKSARLIVQGRDQATGLPVQFPVVVQNISAAEQATLVFVATGFALRPETISAVAGFSETLADDFAAYAQTQRLSVCWLGCQIPAPDPTDCPGMPHDGPCSCHS